MPTIEIITKYITEYIRSNLYRKVLVYYCENDRERIERSS